MKFYSFGCMHLKELILVVLFVTVKHPCHFNWRKALEVIQKQGPTSKFFHSPAKQLSTPKISILQRRHPSRSETKPWQVEENQIGIPNVALYQLHPNLHNFQRSDTKYKITLAAISIQTRQIKFPSYNNVWSNTYFGPDFKTLSTKSHSQH